MRIRSVSAHIRLALVTALGILGLGRPGVAQVAEPAARITVGPATQVSKAHEKRPHAEVILAAEPGERGRLLAGSMVLDLGTGSSVVAYASSDGGKTWGLALEKKAEKGGPSYFDPAVAFDPDGVAYFAAYRPGLETDVRRMPQPALEITSSRDGGRTWAAPFVAENRADRPFLVVDCTNGRFRGRVYCTGTSGGLVVWRSRDGARTFNPPTRLACKGSTQGRTFGQGVVLSDGTLVVPYRVLTKATDQQWSLRVQRSDQGGESFLGEQSLRDYRAGVGDLPIMAVDQGSGAFRDRLYLVWSERTEAGLRVMLTLSKDKGVNWSEPTALSDEAGVAGGEEAARRRAFLPSVAVNRAGVVAVSWYDGTLRGGTLRSHVRLRASLDGGDTWLPSVHVTEFVGQGDPEVASTPGSESWLGDTAGLAADASGGFHPLWIDNRTGTRQVFTTTVIIK